jgi:hypothetical protein
MGIRYTGSRQSALGPLMLATFILIVIVVSLVGLVAKG